MYLKLFRSENISQIHVSKLLHKEVLDSRDRIYNQTETYTRKMERPYSVTRDQ